MPSQAKRTQVLHLIDSGGMYGAEQVVMGILCGLNSAGHRAVLGSIRLPGEQAKPIELAAAAHGVEVWPVVAKRGLDTPAIRSVLNKAAARGIDVVHCHGYKANILVGLVARHASPGPIVTTLHGWTATNARQMRWWYSLVERQLLRRFDAVVAVHGAMRADRRLPSAVRKRLVVIENGIDAATPATPALSDIAAAPPAVQALHAFCEQRPTIAVIGRLSPEKGVDVLIDAFAMLRKDGVQVQLAIIGDGPLKAGLQRKVDELGLSHDVHFSGFIPAASTALAWLKLLVIPSFSEGLPMVMLEAMRARLPVVATSVGGIPEALDHGAAGCLVAPGDARALSLALGALLRDRDRDRDRDRAADYAKVAFLRFSERYSASVMARRYLDLYAELTHASPLSAQVPKRV